MREPAEWIEVDDDAEPPSSGALGGSEPAESDGGDGDGGDDSDDGDDGGGGAERDPAEAEAVGGEPQGGLWEPTDGPAAAEGEGSEAAEDSAEGDDWAAGADDDAAEPDDVPGSGPAAHPEDADPEELATAEPAAEEVTDDVVRGPGPGADLTDDELRRRVAALLFASPEPLSVARLVALLERPPAARVRSALEALGHALEGAGLPFQVRGLRGGYTLMTTPELGQVLARLAKGPTVERISAAALETLAIVAYRQPVTKAEIESIRGVQAGPILRTLVDRGLVKVVGRADVPGHPLQYGTGKEFLDRFGLMSLDELPRDAELARG